MLDPERRCGTCDRRLLPEERQAWTCGECHGIKELNAADVAGLTAAVERARVIAEVRALQREKWG